MADEPITTQSENVAGRWIRYIETDELTGRTRIAVTQIVKREVKYKVPYEMKNLGPADKILVDWLMAQDGTGQIEQVDFLTLSPEQVIQGDEPSVIVNVPYSALGKPDKVVAFSLATVQEVLTEINRVAHLHKDKRSLLIDKYKLIETSEGVLMFGRKSQTD